MDSHIIWSIGRRKVRESARPPRITPSRNRDNCSLAIWKLTAHPFRFSHTAKLTDSQLPKLQYIERLNRKYLSWIFALLLGVLGTVQYHLTQFSSGFYTFFGDRGDVRGVVALCEHWYQALIGHAELPSPGFFYPVR